MNDVTKKLFKKQNVVLVGMGKKITAGVNTGRDAIVVGVTKKVWLEALSRKNVIPKKIKGVETDVIEVGEIKALDAQDAPDHKLKYRPAPGGVSIGHKDITCGTLGMVVKRNGVRHILSNNHVLANENKASIGDSIYQPGPYDGGTADDEIAKLSDFVPIEFNGGSPIPPPSDCPIAKLIVFLENGAYKFFRRKSRFPSAVVPQDITNKVDCALARPDKDEDVLDSILEIGEPSGEAEADIGMKIKGSGRTSGLIYDEIAIIDAVAQVQYSSGFAIFEDQLVTVGPMAQGGDSGTSIFMATGDEGSMVLTEDNKVVGLLFAGSDTVAILNKLSNVKEALSLD